MFLGSSQKVTWRSVVDVGAAVVDCGITTDTAAVSEMKRILLGAIWENSEIRLLSVGDNRGASNGILNTQMSRERFSYYVLLTC